jgi:hypothetical protein
MKMVSLAEASVSCAAALAQASKEKGSRKGGQPGKRGQPESLSERTAGKRLDELRRS